MLRLESDAWSMITPPPPLASASVCVPSVVTLTTSLWRRFCAWNADTALTPTLASG